MRKFHQAQALHDFKLPTDDEFISILCKPYMSKNTTATGSFHLYEMATHQLNSIDLFACSMVSNYFHHIMRKF